MSGASLEGCHTNSGRILNEQRSAGPTVQAILRLLIKTGQCCLLLDSNRMFSARCRWRLQREPVGQSTVASPKNNFHSIPNCRFQLCHRVCVVVSLLYTFFIPGAFLAHVVAPRRPHIQTHTADMFRRSRQAIIFPAITALLPWRLHVSFALTLSLLPIHITSRIDHPWYLHASFLP